MKDPASMSGEELRRESVKWDRRLGREIDRLRLTDSGFREALDRTLQLDAEKERRRNR